MCVPDTISILFLLLIKCSRCLFLIYLSSVNIRKGMDSILDENQGEKGVEDSLLHAAIIYGLSCDNKSSKLL